ncbi:MAG: EF-P beta-lysylation protein EpmB [Planctomycetia bacterium]|nr:EF-P beta-lysylation protein EpmB [Planctomycetia bacterium]
MSIVASPPHSVPGPSPAGKVGRADNVPLPVRRTPAWKTALQEAIRDPAELCRVLDLPREVVERTAAAARLFGLLVPRGFVARMQKGDPNDPLLRQVLPLDAETLDVPGFIADPVGDGDAKIAPGLLQKYAGRALLIVTGACAVHCRYCFRRHFPYSEAAERGRPWEEAVAAIRRDSAIHEIILSGGDPLTLSDGRLAALARRLAAIPHLTRLRIHSRLPIVLPERVCDEFLNWFARSRLTGVMVVHANHPAEIDDSVAAAFSRLASAGVPILNQAVLLRGVNDSSEVLAELCEKLADLRVMPYYLHQLDRVAGAAHFEVPQDEGLRIIAELRRRLPGYAVPRYVREVTGAPSKMPLESRL